MIQHARGSTKGGQVEIKIFKIFFSVFSFFFSAGANTWLHGAFIQPLKYFHSNWKPLNLHLKLPKTLLKDDWSRKYITVDKKCFLLKRIFPDNILLSLDCGIKMANVAFLGFYKNLLSIKFLYISETDNSSHPPPVHRQGLKFFVTHRALVEESGRQRDVARRLLWQQAFRHSDSNTLPDDALFWQATAIRLQRYRAVTDISNKY